MTTPHPHASAESALDAIRRDLYRLDEQLVDALLLRRATPKRQGADLATGATASAFAPPDADAATRFAPLWRDLCAIYGRKVLPLLGQEGSADCAALLVLWKRIACGARVAQAKLASKPEAFRAAIERGDRVALRAAITLPEVEERVVARAVEHATVRLAGLRASGAAAAIGTIYREVVIPCTKDVQVETLLAADAAEESR